MEVLEHKNTKNHYAIKLASVEDKSIIAYQETGHCNVLIQIINEDEDWELYNGEDKDNIEEEILDTIKQASIDYRYDTIIM